MNFSEWIYIYILSYTTVVFTGTVERMFIKNGQFAIQGSDIQIVCEVSHFTSNDVVTFYRLENIPDTLSGQSSLSDCTPNTCFGKSDRLSFLPSSTSVTVAINNLKRSEDEKWWICALGSQRKQLKPVVFTPPERLILSGHTAGGDLQAESLTLTCKSSNCIYPGPTSFQWFYQDMQETNTPWVLYHNTTPDASTTSCSDNEKVYRSTLRLPTYSTWPLQPSNVDKTVMFQCRLSFPTLSSQLQSNKSGRVRYAVQVSNVTLKDGENIAPKSLQVKSGFSTTLTCTPSVSRPAATVLWYIGTEERQRTSSNSTFTFLPQNRDNNKPIFCKAFNLQPEEQAVISNKTMLNVLDTSITQTFYIEGHINQQNVTVDEHDAGIQFKCIVKSNPKIYIRIMFEQDVLVEQVNENSLSFFRRDVSCFDAGVYTCEGSNGYGRKSTDNITLSVQCSPRPFRQIERNVSSYLYSVVILSITVIAYPSPGTKGFSWSKEESAGWLPLLSNADLKISSSALQSNLTLMNISRGDFGLYRVTVTNTIGSYEQHIFLSEEKVSEKQQSDGQCMCQTSEKTALIVGLILGALCCIVIIYATYVTFLKNRLLKKVTRSLDRSGNERYANPTFASNVTEDHRYDGNTKSNQEASVQQYTDLSRYANTDTYTYDVLNKT